MKIVFLRTPYNYDTNAAGDEDALNCKDATRTKQSFKDECDINTLVERFSITGEIPILERTLLPPDIGTGIDFKDAMNHIVAARQSFDQLPGKVRARFHNDPAEFLDYAHDPESLDELRKWGLAKPDEPKIATTPPEHAKNEPAPPLDKGGLGDTNKKGVT